MGSLYQIPLEGEYKIVKCLSPHSVDYTYLRFPVDLNPVESIP